MQDYSYSQLSSLSTAQGIVGAYSHILQNGGECIRATKLGRSPSSDPDERDNTSFKLTDSTVLEFGKQNAYHAM